MRTDLDSLTSQIRENERIWNGFRLIELRIIGTQTVDELVTVLAGDLPRLFPNVCRVTVACLERMHRATRPQSAASDIGCTTSASLLSVTGDTLAALFPRPWRPSLGPLGTDVSSLLFPGNAGGLESCALAPLVLHGELIGCLNQASRHANHFHEDSGTELLEHLAAVTAMCIDNAVIHERLKIDGLTDPLTGLYNRRFFDRRLQEELERLSRRPGDELVGMLVDVDHFKQINDSLGHEAGDRILQSVAGMLGEELRGSDVLARIGGEEFALLLPETDIEQGALIAERLRARIENASWALPGAVPLRVTVSIGMACLGGGRVTKADAGLYRAADQALYKAKQGGRNRVVVY